MYSFAGKDSGQGEKGTTEDEMGGWHHWLNGYEFKQTPGDSERPGSLACCNPWGHEELETTEQQFFFIFFSIMVYHRILKIVACAIYIVRPFYLSILYIQFASVKLRLPIQPSPISGAHPGPSPLGNPQSVFYNMYLLSPFYMPDTILGIGGKTVLVCQRLSILVREVESLLNWVNCLVWM